VTKMFPRTVGQCELDDWIISFRQFGSRHLDDGLTQMKCYFANTYRVGVNSVSSCVLFCILCFFHYLSVVT